MTSFEIIKDICEKQGTSVAQLEKELGFGNGSLAKAKTIKSDRLLAISQKLQVSVNYLLTGQENNIGEEGLTKRDRRDIGKDLDRIMEEIANDEDGPLFYNGEPLKNEDLTFLSRAIEAALTDAKKRNKVTYNPNKNKKQ